jgi:hypothetical protein
VKCVIAGKASEMRSRARRPYNHLNVHRMHLTRPESALATAAARPPCLHEPDDHPMHSVRNHCTRIVY